GDPIVQANAKSRLSGWTVGVAMKESALRADMVDAVLWAASLGGLLCVLTLIGAVAIGRSITRPIAELGNNTNALLAGALPSFGPSPPELSNFTDALRRAIEERDRIKADAESELRESEQRMRSFLENSATIAWLKDEQGRYVFLSSMFERRF